MPSGSCHIFSSSVWPPGRIGRAGASEDRTGALPPARLVLRMLILCTSNRIVVRILGGESGDRLTKLTPVSDTKQQLVDDIDRRREALERRWRRWEPMTLDQRYDAAVEHFGDRLNLITDDLRLTYRQIADRSRELARGLIDIGVHPGDRVAIILDNRAEMIPAKIAISRVGAIAVPLISQYRQPELVAALNQVEASVLITVAQSLVTDFFPVFDAVAPGWETEVHSDQLPHLHHIVVLDAERPGVLDFTELARRGQHIPQATLDTISAQTDPAGISDIVFTSGTSGRPLAAELTHDGMLRDAYGMAYHRAMDDGWRSCFALPMNHVFAYTAGWLADVFAGGAILLRQVFNPPTLLRAAERDQAQEILLVPTMAVALVDQASKVHYDLPHLETLISAAAAGPVWLWERVMEVMHPRMILTGYGQTETSGGSVVTLPTDSLQTIAETVGVPALGGIAAADLPGGRLAQYRTVDPFSWDPLPDGAVGELVVRGPIVAKGYYNDPQRTDEMIRDGWLRSGDLGRIDEHGYVRLTGRTRELFKSGGEMVAPKEIEDLLTQIPGVAQAYVAGIPDELMGEVGCAWVVPNGTVDLDEHELIRYCHTHLAPFKVPRRIVFMDAEDLPLSPTGKVQKFRLVESAR